MFLLESHIFLQEHVCKKTHVSAACSGVLPLQTNDFRTELYYFCISVISVLRLPNGIVFGESVSAITGISRLPNPSVYLTKMFWELFSVISACELLSRHVFGINLVIQQTAKGASGKGPRQKTSKSVKHVFSTLFDIFRGGQKEVKKFQKYFRYFLTIFAEAPIFRPLSGGSE